MSRLEWIVESDHPRLDRWLTSVLPDMSRSKLAQLCLDGKVLVDGKEARPSKAVSTGSKVEIFLAEPGPDPIADPRAQKIPLNILFENEHFLILNKERGRVVHPAPGHSRDTLVNALLYHCGNRLSEIGGTSRPGIVHRIDKDTSGLILVAKTDLFHRKISALIKEREMVREYLALVSGKPKSKNGTIDAPIGRDPANRQRMAVVPNGKEAVTHFSIRKCLKNSSELLCSLVSGRTHQIRVHMNFIGHPIIGDTLYGGRDGSPYIEGQALHACRLSFVDPISGDKHDFKAEPPDDYKAIRSFLETNSGQ